MKLLKALPLIFFALLAPAHADWSGKDATGATVTFDAFANGPKVLPKHVLTDTVGNQVGISTSPLFVSFGAGTAVIGGVRLFDAIAGQAAAVSAAGRLSVDGSGVTQPISGTVTANQGTAWTVAATQSGSWAITASQGPTAWVTNLTQLGGAPLTLTNPVPVQISTGGSAVSAPNPLPTTCVSGCATVPAVATYSVSGSFAAPTSATDWFTLQGSATKTVKIKKISVQPYQSTPASIAHVAVIKRTAANTGGTSAVLTAVRYDSTDPGASAVPRTYSANPTALGTAEGTLSWTLGTLGSNAPPVVTLVYGDRGAKEPTLIGTNEFITINASGTLPAGVLMFYSVEWTEE